MTRQRQIVLDELEQSTSHPTAKELYDTVKGRLPEISLGTVYRNLGVLEGLGLIRRILNGSSCRYDANLEPHYHLVCFVCGKITDVDVSEVAPIDTGALEAAGFERVGYRLEFYGICPDCQSKRETS